MAGSCWNLMACQTDRLLTADPSLRLAPGRPGLRSWQTWITHGWAPSKQELDMHHKQLTAATLARLHQNQVALGEAVWQLARWIEQRGSTEVVQGVQAQLQLLTINSTAINQALTELIDSHRNT